MTNSKTDLFEILNSFGINDAHLSKGSQLKYKEKYIYTCFMGSLHRVVEQLKMEYNTGCVVLQDLVDEDNDMDSKGGYGRMAIERRQGFGYPTDVEKLQERLEVINEDYQAVKAMYDAQNDSYEMAYGAKFEPNKPKAKPLSFKKKADISMTFVPIS